LRVTTRDGDPSGPPGVGLLAAGENYPCSRVTLEFSGERLDQASVTAGAFRDDTLDVPGDADPGTHTLTAACGGPVLASATFRVTDEAVHRPALVTGLPKPDDISFALDDLAKSAGAALIAIPVIFFPFGVIEEVMDDNWEEIVGWFGIRAGVKEKLGLAGVPVFVAFMGITAAFYTALDPSAAFNVTTVVAYLGLLIGLCVVVASEGAPEVRFATRHRIPAPMRALPGSLVIAFVVVALSRLIHFHPGYAFGAVAGFKIKSELDRREKGRLGAASVLSMLAVSLLAWVLWQPVSDIASAGHPSLGIVVLEAALASTFMVGLETCLVLSLPIRFVHGGDVAAWNKWAWAGMFVLVLFPVVHIMFAGGTHLLVTKGVHPLVIVGVMAGFALFTIGFWSYFRFRPERPERPAALA
jgi:hypothetical protein